MLSVPFPVAAQETGFLVAEKIDSGEKPFVLSRGRGRGMSCDGFEGQGGCHPGSLAGPQVASRVGGAFKS